MAARPQGTKYAKTSGTGAANNLLVMTGIGNLYSLFLNWRAVTAGNRVIIHDGIDATGTVIEEIILNNASTQDGINVQMPAVGKEFKTGLYINVAGVNVGELNVSVGYDGNG